MSLTALMAVSSLVTLGVATAQAAPGDPFDATRPTVFVAQSQSGQPTGLYRSETSGDGTYSFSPEGEPVPQGTYNAIAFNESDGYIYGSTTSAVTSGAATIPLRALIRIGQDGVVTRVGTLLYPIAQWVGAFNPDDGLFYTTNGTPGNSRELFAVNVSTGDITTRTLSLTDYTIADFEYQDGYFWAFDYQADQPAGTLVRIDPTNGNMTRFAGVLDGLPTGPWGAGWRFGNGNLGFSNNASGTIAQLKITNGDTDTPTFELVNVTSGPSASGNDGTSIPGSPVDLSITKDAAPTYRSGHDVTYTLTVTNEGDGESSGWVVTDEVPANLSSITATGDGTCVIEGNRVNCSGGRLGVDESAVITITGSTGANDTTCFTNTATVLGNEYDPIEENNEDSAEVCSRQLSVEKTSDATADTRVGDTVNYTVTATNTGTVPYTADDPAYLFDSLAGVIDDASYNDDAGADLDGDVSYTEPVVSWSGALGVDQSVELTYSVTIMAGGDGEVRNVAWEPNNPEVSTPPACDAPTNGTDSGTLEACAEHEFLLPRLTIEKTTDRETLPAIGETVEYTVTVTNEGPGAYTAAKPATFTDDLTNVLDAADYNDDAEANTGTVAYTEPTLSWEGELAAGQSAEVTYTATYTGEGDYTLVNLACVPTSETLPGAESCASVTTPGSALTQWKQVESNTSPVAAGSVLKYTLFFENSGEAAASVDAIDDLTHVLDDAEVSVEPSSDDLTVSRDGNRISVTGLVPADGLYSVSYEVTVLPDGERGDDIAANYLLANDPADPPQPPETPVCQPDDVDAPECTVTPIAAVSYEKSVEASDSIIGEGTVLTYTITVRNTGTAAGSVSREDVLTDVLDDAELTSDPESDTPSVIVTGVQDDRFSISGTLAADSYATITYEVTVLPDSERGNHSVANFLVPPGETPPAECASDECTVTPLPFITASKTVDPESGTTVLAGDEVTYRLTFTNDGGAPGAVEYIDFLEGVLDDAELVGAPIVSDSALTATPGSDNTLAVSGILDPDATVTVEYIVTVLPDGERGDNLLGNVLAPAGTQTPDCDDPRVSCTENPVPLLTSWKTVTPSETPVAAGTVLTYTLWFENTGEAAASVDVIDDLTHVLDDADVTVEPSSDDLTVLRDGSRISVTGEVPADGTYSVSYEVTVLPDGERGDDIAANYLLANDPTDPPQPPETPVCQPGDEEAPECTVTPIGRLLTSKSVSADSDPVVAGTVLTYTLTFDNQGQGPIVVNHTDYLADVLDDAALTLDPSPLSDALEVSAVVDDEFTITGSLAAGEVVTVSYEVTVNAEHERGNNSVANFLVPGGDVPPSECEAGDGNCTITPLPQIGVEKSAVPESGAGLQAGDEVTYTLTFSNTGEAAGPVDFTDYLADVLDDAEITVLPAASVDSLAVTTGDDGLIRVTGVLDADQVATVEYTVTVLPDGERGDNQLRNIVAPSDSGDAECGDVGVSCTEHPIGELVSWKTVDPASGTTLRPGDFVTYTLHFENVGNDVVEVSRDDVLTEVLDDAEVTVPPAASSDSLAATEIVDGRFNVSGSLAADELVTVSYEVTVLPDGSRGDDRLGNFLVPAGEEPPALGECEPVDPERPSCTVNHVSNVTVTKSSDPESGSEIEPGEEVTYTLTFENVSTNPSSEPVSIDYTDSLVNVLDDATLVSDPVVSAAGLSAEVSANAIRVTGAVSAGETITVGYTVKVKAYEDQGDHVLGNVIAVTGETPVCVPDSPLCTEHPLVPGPELSETGAGAAWPGIAVSLLLVLGGATLMLTSRRRVTA